jgi:hypothetical protein
MYAGQAGVTERMYVRAGQAVAPSLITRIPAARPADPAGPHHVAAEHAGVLAGAPGV